MCEGSEDNIKGEKEEKKRDHIWKLRDGFLGSRQWRYQQSLSASTNLRIAAEQPDSKANMHGERVTARTARFYKWNQLPSQIHISGK